MGTWNYGCMASNQMIGAAARCRVVVLSQQAGYEPLDVSLSDGRQISVAQIAKHSHGAEAYWEPISGFIEATYCEYGRFKLVFTRSVRRTLVYLLSLLVEGALITPGGEHRRDCGLNVAEFLATMCPGVAAVVKTRWHDDVDIWARADLDEELAQAWDHVAGALTAHRAFYAHPICHQVRPLALGVVHEEAYQGLVDFTTNFSDFRTSSYQWKDFILQVRAHMKETLQRFGNVGDDPIQQLSHSFHKASALFEAVHVVAGLDSSSLRMLRHWLGSVSSTALYDADEDGSAMLAELTPVLSDVYALVAMREMNIIFSPMVSIVTDEGTLPGERYAKFVNSISARVVRAADEVAFGPFQKYRAEFTSPAHLRQVLDQAESWDVRAHLLEEHWHGEPEPFAVFEVTIDDLADVRRMLEELGDSQAAASVQAV